jgi:hypothetical protein
MPQPLFDIGERRTDMPASTNTPRSRLIIVQ